MIQNLEWKDSPTLQRLQDLPRLDELADCLTKTHRMAGAKAGKNSAQAADSVALVIS
jgi:hypothetical protein